jgi:hypothetical protein
MPPSLRLVGLPQSFRSFALHEQVAIPLHKAEQLITCPSISDISQDLGHANRDRAILFPYGPFSLIPFSLDVDQCPSLTLPAGQ